MTHDLPAILAAHADWLRGKDGKRADLREAKLNGADLCEAKLNGADLHGANLRGADLREANLNETNLNGADLREAKLNGADLHGANLRGADLRYAVLRGADLREAKLNGADLHGADLRRADLRGAVGIIIGGQDARGYMFYATQNDQDVLVLHAGCYAFVGITAARRHWQNRHGDDPLLQADCLSLVDRIERLAALRGWKLEPEASALGCRRRIRVRVDARTGDSMRETRCTAKGCDAPADGLDGKRCVEHWEAISDALWWEQVRAATFAVAGIKNAKDGKEPTKGE